MSDIIIRKANEKDAEQIAEVMLDFYNMENQQEAENAFKSELSKDYKYILALENGSIVGLVTWLMHGLPKHGLFELDRICILSKSRGKGVGRILVNALIDDAKNWYQDHGSKIRKLYLLTHEDNISAQAFYEKVGFYHEATLNNHYYDKKDERLYSIFFKD
ncbi:MAG: GNAT family N-acetyltransferase [Candidatus Marinimicrobia bacterium]|jgi:ribosomal protein S18 acetylase RimI-like enzyme|nr:GNAT family N-acetyltransferase [Candidatus Neomarinimicrobiota bacterium]